MVNRSDHRVAEQRPANAIFSGNAWRQGLRCQKRARRHGRLKHQTGRHIGIANALSLPRRAGASRVKPRRAPSFDSAGVTHSQSVPAAEATYKPAMAPRVSDNAHKSQIRTFHITSLHVIQQKLPRGPRERFEEPHKMFKGVSPSDPIGTRIDSPAVGIAYPGSPQSSRLA